MSDDDAVDAEGEDDVDDIDEDEDDDDDEEEDEAEEEDEDEDEDEEEDEEEEEAVVVGGDGVAVSGGRLDRMTYFCLSNAAVHCSNGCLTNTTAGSVSNNCVSQHTR